MKFDGGNEATKYNSCRKL